MSQSEIQLQRPQRADARANRDKLAAAARALFTEKGTSAPLEEVAERAGVGIGTLYRHFPTRQALLEAVYVDEVEAMARAATELEELPPWEALSEWLHQYVGFAATKRALNAAMLPGLAQQLELETELQVELAVSADHAEGVAAFAEKRAPAFRGLQRSPA